jgi:hypothetical protein
MGLKEADETASHLKAGFLGFAGSGKTHTAMEMAIGARKFFKLDGPIAMFDTERGSDYWASRVLQRTGKKLLVEKARSLDALMEVALDCEKRGVSVLVVDSVTHVWREVCDAYLSTLQETVRETNKAKGWNRRIPERLEFQDWGRIKASWSRWPDWFINSPMHVIVCGRAGWEYEHEEDDRGKKQLIKSGVKMKSESEFGFESSILIEMYKEMDSDTHALTPHGRVLKDRFDLLDGKDFPSPTFNTWMPHIERLVASAHAPVNTTGTTKFEMDERGRSEWEQEKAKRDSLAEEIEHIFTLLWPGQTGDEKRARAAAAEMHWPGVKSKKALLEQTASHRMATGLESFRLAMSEQIAEAKAKAGIVEPAKKTTDEILKGDDMPPDFGPTTEAA